MSWGSYWGGYWGGGEDPPNLVDVLVRGESLSSEALSNFLDAVIAVGPNRVKVDFSRDLNLSHGPNFDAGTYQISPPLTVHSVQYGWNRTVVLNTDEMVNGEVYTLTINPSVDFLADGNISLGADRSRDYIGYPASSTFSVSVQSATRFGLVLSSPLTSDPHNLETHNYTVTDLQGNTVVVDAVTPLGSAPYSMLTLEIAGSLDPLSYYAVTVTSGVVTEAGHVFPQVQTAQYVPVDSSVPLVIKLSDFSGEITGGLFGSPEGQVFFSPALNVQSSGALIEVEEASVCTVAYDSYVFPQIPDPSPLFIFGGATGSLIGTGVVWATAERLGQARVSLSDLREDSLEDYSDGPASGTLSETIDITRASFLNDSRWKIYPGTGGTVFQTADNLTPIGPGPVTPFVL